jgi:hypothetical protein
LALHHHCSCQNQALPTHPESRTNLSLSAFHGLLAWLISTPFASLVAEPLAKRLGTFLLGIHLDFAFHRYRPRFGLGFVPILAILAPYLLTQNASGISVKLGLAMTKSYSLPTGAKALSLWRAVWAIATAKGEKVKSCRAF